MDKKSNIVERAFSRRGFIAGAGSVAAAVALTGCADDTVPSPIVPTSAFSDVDILNFALNLEYLESEYYLRAATGAGLSTADAGSGAGTVTAPTGGPVTTGNALYTNFLNEFAQSELAHVRLLQKTITSLGGTPISRPTIDLQASFITLATTAGVPNAATFNPFSSWNNFIVGVAIFEDIGVTAYTGSAPLISNAAVLDAAAGIQAKEAYTGALARTLIAAGASGSGADMTTLTNANLLIATINKLGMADGSSAGGAVPINSGVSNGTLGTTSGSGITLTPADSNSLAYGRTPNQVLHIAYGKSTTGVYSGGGFFPNGLNGTIKTTTA